MPGTIGRKTSDATKLKLSILAKGRKFSEEHKRNISKSKLGKSLSEEHKKKLSIVHTGIKLSDEHRRKQSEGRMGSKHWRWLGGNDTLSKRRKVWVARRRSVGKIDIRLVQLLYEDNIKKYGTLTCYLCEMPIEFGKDTLEHKTPISRGGTNLYENLEISCRSCNSKKYNKTVKEYLESKVK